MAKYFEVTGPRDYPVFCDEEYWFGHILIEHPEMKGCEDLVMEAIGNPLFSMIFEERGNPERNVYYTRHGSHGYFVRVVVEFSADHRGELITALMADSLRPGDRLLWTPALSD